MTEKRQLTVAYKVPKRVISRMTKRIQRDAAGLHVDCCGDSSLHPAGFNSRAVRRPKPTCTARGTVAAILDELDERMGTIRTDADLSPEAKRRLLRVVLLRTQTELGALAGVAGIDQAFLADALAEVADLTVEQGTLRPEQPWWAVWRRVTS